MEDASFISTPRTKRTRVAGLCIKRIDIRVCGGQRGLKSESHPNGSTHKMRCGADVQIRTTHLGAGTFVAKNDHVALGDVYKDTQNLNSLPIVALPDIRKPDSLPIVALPDIRKPDSLPVVALPDTRKLASLPVVALPDIRKLDSLPVVALPDIRKLDSLPGVARLRPLKLSRP